MLEHVEQPDDVGVVLNTREDTHFFLNAEAVTLGQVGQIEYFKCNQPIAGSVPCLLDNCVGSLANALENVIS